MTGVQKLVITPRDVNFVHSVVLIEAEGASSFNQDDFHAQQVLRNRGDIDVGIVQTQPVAASAESRRIKVHLDRQPGDIKLVVYSVNCTMEQLGQAICAKFALPFDSKLQLYLTGDKIKVDEVEELSDNDNITVCLGVEVPT
eukprot:TRINITY_DN11730_c0_g1_i3.p3 TRINITY_DN11730_c0_g1~~TRINITY_DN11730_c0_g1_i3.p3  ORF type:complete len:142 (+),score=35.46 TRINITY_DN11730_c0_g1_i3:448-873(+)